MKSLQDIGLTKRESQIYQLMLTLGECSISVVQKETGLHPQIVYRTIDSLKDKGLIIVITKNNKKYVSAEHPKKLQTIAEERLQDVKKLIPELASAYVTKKDLTVRTSKGEEAIRAFRMNGINTLKKSDTYYIIGGSGDRFYDVMGDRYKESEELRIKKKINKKLITFANERQKLVKDKYRLFSQFRYLPSNYPITSSINIYGNHVGIIIWASEPILVHIESAEVADSHKKYFDELWKISES